MWTRVNNIDRMFGVMDLLRSRMNLLFTDFDRSYENDYGWEVAETNSVGKTAQWLEARGFHPENFARREKM